MVTGGGAGVNDISSGMSAMNLSNNHHGSINQNHVSNKQLPQYPPCKLFTPSSMLDVTVLCRP